MTPAPSLIAPLTWVGLALLIAPAIHFNSALSWHDQQRIAQILLFGFVALVGLRAHSPVARELDRLPRWALALLAVGFALGAASAFSAAFPRFALLEWATLLLLVWTAWVLSIQCTHDGERFDTLATNVLIAVAVIIGFKVLVNYVATLAGGYPLHSVEFFSGSFSNRRFFGQAATIIIPILAYPLVKGSLPRTTKIALFLLLAAWWMLVILSATRGTILALAVAATVLALIATPMCRSWLKWQGVALITGAGLYLALFILIPMLLGLETTLENRLGDLARGRGRRELWLLAWQHIMAHPWLGTGPMHFAAVNNGVGAHPHNAILQLAAEWGVIAAMCFIAPVTVGLWKFLSTFRSLQADGQDAAALRVCLGASMVGAAVHALVDGVLAMPYSQLLVTFIAGWSIGLYLRTTQQAAPCGGWRRLSTPMELMAVAAFVLVVWGAYPEALQTSARAEAYREAIGPRLAPRYWEQGWIP